MQHIVIHMHHTSQLCYIFTIASFFYAFALHYHSCIISPRTMLHQHSCNAIYSYNQAIRVSHLCDAKKKLSQITIVMHGTTITVNTMTIVVKKLH